MNMNEMTETIEKMNNVDFEKLVELVAIRKNVQKKQELADMVKKITLGSFVSYMRGKAEVVGEVVAVSKKAIFLETTDGHKRTLAFEDVFKVYPERPVEAKEEPKAEKAKVKK